MPARIRHSPLAAATFADLPVLPFLAPRLLKPWPGQIRRGSSKSNKGVKERGDGASETRYRGVRHDERRTGQSEAARCLQTNAQLRPTIEGRSKRQQLGRESRVNYSTVAAEATLLGSYEDVDIDSSGQGGHKTNRETDESDRAEIVALLSRSKPQKSSTAKKSSTAWVPSPEERAALEEVPLLKTAYEFMEVVRARKDTGKTVYLAKIWDDWFKWRLNVYIEFKGQRDELFEKSNDLKLSLIDAAIAPDADINKLRDTWLQFGVGSRRANWPLLALNILAKSPEAGLKFLIWSLTDSLPMRKQVSDVLDFLLEHHLSASAPRVSDGDFNLLFQAVIGILERFSGSQVSISDFAVYKLYQNANRQQAEQLHSVLKTRGKRLHINARLFAIERLSKLGATDSAMEVVQTLHRDNISFARPEVESVCATLLRNSQRDADAKYHESDISSLLLQFGLTPRVNFYNILLHNATESGDSETAWKVYDMMLENGITPSVHTYSILLNDAKWRLDVQALNRVITEVRNKDIRNEYIANDMLHAMWLLHEKRSKGMSPQERHRANKALWKRMLSLYSSYFKTGPLEDFSEVFDFQKTKLAFRTGRLMHPDYPTLNMLIGAALKLRIKDHEVMGCYKKYRQLLMDGHPDMVRIGQHGFLSDTFIMRLGESSELLPHCMTVLADMLGAQPARNPSTKNSHITKMTGKMVELASSPQTQPQPILRLRLPFKPPSVHTWNLLLSAFMKQSQPRAAEKVLSMMQAKGIQPTDVTWNNLIFGYSKLGDDEGLVGAIVRSERAGRTVRADSWKAIGGVHIQAGVMGQVLQKLEENKGKKARQDGVVGEARLWRDGELELKDDSKVGGGKA